MKMKKILIIGIVLILICASGITSVNAASTNILQVVKESSTTKNLENDQGYISKSIVNSDPENGEVTVELKLSNTKKETETVSATEVFLVIDNSPSMDFMTTAGVSRKQLVVDSAYQLVKSMFDISKNIKVGLIDFEGIFAGMYDASMRQKLTEDEDTILKAVNDQKTRNGYMGGTNIDAGLKNAENNFSENAGNKVIILLTDGIPTSDAKGNSAGNNVVSEKAIEVQNNTKQTILDLKKKGIYTIAMLTGMDATDKDENGNSVWGENQTLEESLEAAERIFGTPTNPTADKYYLAQSTDVDSVITEEIFKDVSSKISNPINTVEIVDYFPEDITENFTFEYVGKPNVGEISDVIDEENHTITWNMDTLKGDETATVKYKLKLKDMDNEELLDKVISTNEKVVLTYKDTNEKSYTVTLTDSPQIKLTQKEEEREPDIPDVNIDGNGTGGGTTTGKDNTMAQGTIPQTGESLAIFAVISIVVVIGIVAMNKYKKNMDI